jgi:hypothetical protein
MPADVEKALEINGKLTQEKTLWNNHWQLVHEYYLQRKADFTVQREGGAFLNSDIWTAVPGKAAETCASALLGLVWPDSQSFALEPAGDLAEDEECKEWFEKTVTKNMQADLDDPEAGLSLALDEFMIDFVVSGTPALHSEEGDKSTYRFDAWNVQQFSIDEGADGFVDTFYKVCEYTLRQAVKKFTVDKLSKKSQDAWKGKQYTDKIKVLHVIEPRDVVPGKGTGPLNMPWASIYVEMDAKHLIRESGYNELPTFAVRYSKRIGEKYGRSPAMRSLPDVMELNALWEIVTLGLEKNFDPPLAVYDDGVFGGGTIDTSAGALNVVNVSGKLGAAGGVQPIFTVGQFGDVAVLIERLEQTINDHFMIDRLLDLDNEKEMTAREAMIRQSIRQKALRSVISRLLTELFNRLLERCFNIGLRRGRFGYAAESPEAVAWQANNPGKDMKVIPQKIVDMQGSGERVYRIRYMTPAAREAEAEAAQGILNILEVIQSAVEIDKTVMDEINLPRTMKKLGNIWSVPVECWNTEDEKKKLRAAGAAANQEAAQLNKAEMVAGIAKDAAIAQNAGRSTTQRLQ